MAVGLLARRADPRRLEEIHRVVRARRRSRSARSRTRESPSEHRQGMGGTIILWEALRTDQIALYPEYTGTIGEEILKASPTRISAEAMRNSSRNSASA